MNRLEKFIRDPSAPFYIWLRFLVGQRLREAASAAPRDGRPRRGPRVSIYQDAMPGVSTGAIAARLLGKLTGTGDAALRAEWKI